MNKALAWMAENHVAANLLMMVLVVGGLFMAFTVKQEVFPDVLLDIIQVQVEYPGASPEEVEDGIVLQIEENIRSIEGIKQIRSVAAEGMATVMAELLDKANPDRVLQDIQSEVDRIVTFPEDAEKPIVSKLLNRRDVISIILYGDASEKSLRENAEIIRDDLLDLPEISQVEIGGVRPYEISIEIPEDNLRRYNLTLEQVASRVGKASLDIPGGVIKTPDGQVLLRTKERRYHGKGYEEIDVITDRDGMVVKLDDISVIKDSFAETDESARMDGKTAAMITVFRVGDERPLDISDAVRDYVSSKNSILPPSIRLAVWNDRAEMLQGRMHLLIKNAIFGLVLVFITLTLFLQMSLAVWVMLGIPISFLGAILLMPTLDVSINMISLFAFIMALGIVVDDAIVVGENIFEHRQNGKNYARAAIDGVQEVAVPVCFSIFTSVVAFLPLAYTMGVIGKFIKVIPYVVISVLLISLVESLFVLPAHLSIKSSRKERKASEESVNFLERIRRWFAVILQRFINTVYKESVKFAIDYRYLTVAFSIAVFLMGIGLVKGGILKFRFMPAVDGNVIKASLKMPLGTDISATSEVEEYIEDKARYVLKKFNREHLPEGESVYRHIYAVVGASMPKGGPAGMEGNSGSHLADVAVLLVPGEERDVSSYEIESLWRNAVGEIPGIESLTFQSNVVHIGANIDIMLAHKDFSVLEQAASRIKEQLAKYPGVGDIEDSHSQGKKEIKIRLTSEAKTLGITEIDLGRQVRSAFYGAEALRLQRGRDEVKVMVRYPEEYRKTMTALKNMRVRTPDGGEIPLERAAHLHYGHGFSLVNRTDQKRVINVEASVDNNVANAEEILDDLKKGVLKEIVQDYPGLSYDMEGEEKERKESMESMIKGFSFSLLCIYVLLAIPFRSYVQPFIVMSAIPFGLLGAIFGHLIMGYSLSILSIFGIVALSGVVVNDSLLFIDYINRQRAHGVNVYDAAVTAGLRRFRPILLTSLTTYFGLAPMIFERSIQAQFLIPMALSLGYGVLAATFITLIIIPSLYMIFEDLKRLVRF